MSEPSKAMPAEWLMRLFVRLRAIYGNRVGTMWGEADPDEVRQVWGEQLGGFDGADLRDALGDMVAAYPDYPPTLPQFVGLCIDAKRRRMGMAPKLDDGSRVPMPPHIREQLNTFLNAKVRGRA